MLDMFFEYSRQEVMPVTLNIGNEHCGTYYCFFEEAEYLIGLLEEKIEIDYNFELGCVFELKNNIIPIKLIRLKGDDSSDPASVCRVLKKQIRKNKKWERRYKSESEKYFDLKKKGEKWAEVLYT